MLFRTGRWTRGLCCFRLVYVVVDVFIAGFPGWGRREAAGHSFAAWGRRQAVRRDGRSGSIRGGGLADIGGHDLRTTRADRIPVCHAAREPCRRARRFACFRGGFGSRQLHQERPGQTRYLWPGCAYSNTYISRWWRESTPCRSCRHGRGRRCSDTPKAPTGRSSPRRTCSRARAAPRRGPWVAAYCAWCLRSEG
jgi:hypothetical protein